MKLKKFEGMRKQRKIIVGSIIGILILIGSIILYRSYALYKEEKTFNVLRGKVPHFSKGDIEFAVLLDGASSTTIPKKNAGYNFDSVVCDNEAIGEWDNEKWGVFVSNLSNSKTTCTLSFVTNTSNNASDYLISIANNSTELVYDETADNNLRYVGANPNNYVEFNGELWRIIGVMNNITDSEGNVGRLVKIVRNESIGDYYWSGRSSSSSTNNWINSSLNTQILNIDFYKELSSNSQDMLASIVWNLGASSSKNITTSEFYTRERGEALNGRPKTWIGKIALLYPSDYGFATSGGESQSREVCLNETLGTSYSINDCGKNNWLLPSTTLWTLMPSGLNAYCLSSFGVGESGVYLNQYSVFPALYLSSNVNISDGDGSQENPYKIEIN